VIKSPIGWIGGKAYLAKKIVDLFPPHKHYVEVCAGGLHVFFAKVPSVLETVNDLNRDLVNFWIVCRDNCEVLLRKMEWTPYSRYLYEKWKSEPMPDDPIEWAARWFYLNCAAFSSVYHGVWSYRKSAVSGGALAMRFRSRIQRLEAVRDRLANVQIECSDFRAMLERYGDEETNLLYIDPPYVDADQCGYVHRFSARDHGDLAELALESKANIILTYDNHPSVWEAYSDWNIYRVSVLYRSMAAHGYMKPGSNAMRKENLIITNYEPVSDLFPIDLGADEREDDMPIQRWTPEQEQFLIDNYGKLSIEELLDGVCHLMSGFRTKGALYRKIEHMKAQGRITNGGHDGSSEGDFATEDEN